MTPEELCGYKMDKSEKQIWQELVQEIEDTFLVANLANMPKEVVKNEIVHHTKTVVPYIRCKGFHKTEGFYDIEIGDRGEIHRLFLSKYKEKARIHLLKTISHDISYRYIITTQKYKVMVKKLTKDRNLNEEYRSDWFSLLLQIEKQVLPYTHFLKEVEKYENYINHQVTNKPWTFDENSMQFIYQY